MRFKQVQQTNRLIAMLQRLWWTSRGKMFGKEQSKRSVDKSEWRTENWTSMEIYYIYYIIYILYILYIKCILLVYIHSIGSEPYEPLCLSFGSTVCRLVCMSLFPLPCSNRYIDCYICMYVELFIDLLEKITRYTFKARRGN